MMTLIDALLALTERWAQLYPSVTALTLTGLLHSLRAYGRRLFGP